MQRILQKNLCSIRGVPAQPSAFSLYLRDAADDDRHVENPAELPAVVSRRALFL